ASSPPRTICVVDQLPGLSNDPKRRVHGLVCGVLVGLVEFGFLHIAPLRGAGSRLAVNESITPPFDIAEHYRHRRLVRVQATLLATDNARDREKPRPQG